MKKNKTPFWNPTRSSACRTLYGKERELALRSYLKHASETKPVDE